MMTDDEWNEAIRKQREMNSRYKYVVVFKAKNLDSQREAVELLRAYGAVHVFEPNVWLLKTHYPWAEDIGLALDGRGFKQFVGDYLVLKLVERTGTFHGISAEAEAWIREHLWHEIDHAPPGGGLR
jgi:hypothetical protein